MTATASIPRTVADITPVWLTAALHSTGAATGTAVAVETAPVGVGVGLIGALARLTPTWVDGAGPASIVAKQPSPDEESRVVAAELGMYRKEVRFYEELADRCPVRLADCYFADFDEDSDDFVLLLEDLAGGRVVDQLGGCSRADAEVAVDCLAELHAGFWDDATLVDHDWLALLAESPLSESIADAFDDSWGPVHALFAERIPAEVAAVGDRLATRLPEITARLSEAPFTLNHGDYKLDNIFFGSTSGVALCDWQMVDCARGGRDVAYFLTQSLVPEARAAWEKPLLQRYVAGLESRSVEGYSLETAWQDYRLGVLFAFAYAVVACGWLDNTNTRATGLGDLVLDRCSAAILALGCRDLVDP